MDGCKSFVELAALYPSNLAFVEELVRLFFEPSPRKSNGSFSEDKFSDSGRDVRLDDKIKDQSTNKKNAEKIGKGKECGFCKNNGELANFYRHHTLRDEKGIVVCPVLRAYRCPLCNNNGGDNAHTVRYCPLNTSPKTVPIATSLKTRRTSTGKRRK